MPKTEPPDPVCSSFVRGAVGGSAQLDGLVVTVVVVELSIASGKLKETRPLEALAVVGVPDRAAAEVSKEVEKVEVTEPTEVCVEMV